MKDDKIYTKEELIEICMMIATIPVIAFGSHYKSKDELDKYLDDLQQYLVNFLAKH